ncbi:phage major capsid protein [Eubacterium maltosivorans]|uniref:phage major capsid protein n=1 Tax=Eubacterium maltosivorans TaxID=2041044 RepID=UPI001A990A78|nr:major capsid protein [[Clostridium] methoxybenzovorans]
MKSKDMLNAANTEILQRLHTAVKEDNEDAFVQAWTDYANNIQESVLQEARGLVQAQDVAILNSRGVRQLTSEERSFYEKTIEAMRSTSPQQALADLDVVMPKTTIDAIFEDLQQTHELLGAVTFMNTSGLVEYYVNTNTKQLASWSTLTAEITKELASGFKKINLAQNKLSAWIPVAKAMLDLGPVWLDRYVRILLGEAIAYGLEDAIINGDGKNKPIGMIRQVGEGVTVTDGVYPAKTPEAVTSFAPEDYGALVAKMAVTPNGNYRTISEVLLVVNPVDYLKLVLPATTLLKPDGTYANNVLPFPTRIVQSAQMAQGKAVFGLANRYFIGIGTAQSGKIEYSDEYKFLEDERTYLTKLYGHGEPLDNTAFIYADISGLKPMTYKVTATAGE